MKDYRSIDDIIKKNVDNLHAVYDIAYERGLKDGKENSYSKLDLEQQYQYGYMDGRKSVALDEDTKKLLSIVTKYGLYEDGLNDLWASIKYIVDLSYSHDADTFKSNLESFLKLTPRRAMARAVALRCKKR